MSILPDNIMNIVETEFKTRQSKAVALELLTSWKKMPTWKEKDAIGERHGRNVKTVHEISQKLQELELFTAEQGSIPLFRMELEKQSIAPSGLEDLQERADVSDSPKIMTELPDVSPLGFPLDEEDETMTPIDTVISPEEFGTLQNKVYRIEAEIASFGKKLDNIIPTIQGLSARAPESNPPENPKTETPIASQTPQREIAEPFASLSREEITELAINQPQKFLAIVGSTGGRFVAPGLRETDVMAAPETIRKMIIEVRTYTMMLYEKAISDGAFEGSMSDFLNDMAEKYFEDRGYALGWHRFDPARRG